MFLTALLAGMLGRAATCSAPAVLSVPLNSSQANYRVRAGSHRLVVVKDAPGWQVEVYRSSDRKMSDNLLAPQRNWHGAFPFQVQPGTEAVFGAVRRIRVRGTQADVCIRVIDAQLVGDEFVHGSLQIGWERPAQ
jgi:hypothetical protein